MAQLGDQHGDDATAEGTQEAAHVETGARGGSAHGGILPAALGALPSSQTLMRLFRVPYPSLHNAVV